MPAPQIIIDLVERFGQQIDSYKSGSYNETQVRREFLDPFFKALGWDVDNTSGYAEAYKDVVHEDSIKIGGFTKAPDYCFRIGGTRKFFLEAKKPSISIKDDIAPAFQLRRYAWSAKLPLSVLSDFEELAVYDCRIKPSKTDKSSKGRTLYITYDEYPERWDEIEAIFSREAILKGSFDKYASSGKARRGTAEVDAAFLKEIESWRELLAKNIALRNPQLSQRELNVSVQQTIDRIIFLRICEDRGIDEYNSLRAVTNGAHVYPRLCKLFQKADEKYNSGLFHFSNEKGREFPDELSLGLAIDDKPLKDIIGGLYYPDCPYEFSVLSADILGQVYEQFLGKVIRLTDGHRAVIEDKPEVKKTGGVYYTPTYIVDYIVKNTVGALAPPLANKTSALLTKGDQGEFSAAAQALPAKSITPKQVEKLRILDPACGSGSFLIGAYQYLLDWHRDWYVADNPQKWAGNKNPVLYQSQGGEWKLTTAERRRILLNNIYGVDIDPQAVEVTKLSLLLKVLEGESEQSLSKQLTLFQERALPDLDSNIKCGNSLIGPDYYQGHQATLFDDEERLRVNVFDWNAEFPDIMKSGGFDAVIGNPPYVRQEMLGEFKGYLQKHYEVYHGVADLYAYFVERGITLLRTGGLFSYIVANKWMRANYGEPLRAWLKSQDIKQIIDFGDLPVFKKATTYPCILVVSRAGQIPLNPPFAKGEDKKSKKHNPPFEKGAGGFSVTQVKTLSFGSLESYIQDNHYTISHAFLDNGGWSLSNEKTQALLDKIKTKGVPLGEYVQGKIYYGIKTGFNAAFVIDEKTRKRLIAEDPKSAEIIKPFLAGRDIKRYQTPISDKYLIFTRRGINIQDYPAIGKYLLQFKERLMPKPKDWKGNTWNGRKPGAYKWYEIQDTIDYYQEFERAKIIVPAIVKRASYAFDNAGFYSNDKTTIIATNDLYLLGVINSTAVDFVIHFVSSTKQGGYFEYKPMYLVNLPIRTINFSDPADKKRHDNMVGLVEQMLSSNKQLAAAKTAHEKTALQRQITATDRQIDNLVYELYGLSDEEIKIVEEGR